MTTSAVLHSMENLENLWVHQILHRERDNGLLKWFWSLFDMLDLCPQIWQSLFEWTIKSKVWLCKSLSYSFFRLQLIESWSDSRPTLRIPVPDHSAVAPRNLWEPELHFGLSFTILTSGFIHDAFFCRYCYCSTKEPLQKALSHHQWRNEASPYSHRRDWLRPFLLDIHWGTAPNKAAGHNKSSPRGTSAVKHSRR